MAFAPGTINVTKLLQLLEEGKGEIYKSKNGDDMIKVNINFSQDQFISMGGFNTNLSLWSSQKIGKCIFGNFKTNFEHLRKDGII